MKDFSPSRRLALGALGLAAAQVLAAPARAADWPGDRPIMVIVPFPAGGGVDVMTRVLLQHVQPHLPGARFVVENRVGAAGQIGFEAIFRAAPDGYTLGAITTPAANTIAIERQPQYRIAEFTFLANVVDDPGGFFVRPDSPWRNLDDLRQAARQRPGELAYGTAGVGSDDHLLGLALEAAADIRLSHIPYNGTPPIITDLLGGSLAIGSLNMGEGVALLKEGRARALAQGGTERWAGTPDVPTFREQGFEVIGGSARGIVGPPGLPAAIRERITAAIGAALASDAFRAEAAKLNLPLRPITGAEYQAFVMRNDAAARALWERRPWRE
ncbi:tripartite tricarboxylate transporter substrate binding protein [Pseudoroseomonas globiformis]|uniref:Tripartite tricarboxylate transporter substrate binding protein n=1 Tax=Teichococcus globiformis TaxID=2307229 RepID=A0ABV7G3S4_9PROT